jgi:cytochrome c biogenesis protein CcdA
MGMRHALEADHLAAVMTLSAGSRGRAVPILRGAAWGVGHTIALLAVGGVCLAIGVTISEQQGAWFDRAVGVMLVGLGANVLIRLRRRRVHMHVHQHGDGIVHVHAHRHPPDELHDRSAHEHPHPQGLHLRAVVVGMIHGVAGSAALLLLAASAAKSFWLGLAYIGLFGVGSILGMAVLSAVIAVPLELSARRLARLHHAVEVLVAVGTIALGTWMAL